jgi:hypothetical protein
MTLDLLDLFYLLDPFLEAGCDGSSRRTPMPAASSGLAAGISYALLACRTPSFTSSSNGETR